MRHLAWVIATAAGFLLGLYLGQREAQPTGAGATDGPARAVAIGAATPPGESTPGESTPGAAAPVPGFAGPAPAADWRAQLARHDELVRRGDFTAAAALAARLLGEVLGTARAGDPIAARGRLDAYLARNPFDAEAHLIDSDLWQMQGRQDLALEPLLALLEFADEPALIRRARDKLALILNVRETELANRGDLPALIRYFDEVSRRDPGFDGHRLRLAHWQLRAGQLAEAERTLAQTGSVGVDPQAREDLAAALTLARSGLPLERRRDSAGAASALHVRARAQGVPLRLLVDTGATTTVLARARAEALGAVPSGQRVWVRTAGGVVEAELSRLRDLEVGALHLEALDVLVLQEPLPDGVDGLLGMDVLGRFPELGAGVLPGDTR